MATSAIEIIRPRTELSVSIFATMCWEFRMSDALMILGLLAGFAGALLYVWACDHITLR
jgi:hypothetical protein